MIEIYMEKIQDLLDRSKTNLQIGDDTVRGIYIKDVTETYVTCEDEVHNCIRIGNDNRSIAYTNMNAQSSRSHSIFILTIIAENSETKGKKTGKLYLVDLAGSEKISKTGAEGQTLDEAKTINKSLSTLGIVITKLTEKGTQHVPYRSSKLTRVLQESLGGNSRTALIINCSPARDNIDETISTLDFGKRAKAIKQKAVLNQEKSLEDLKREIDQLTQDNKILKLENEKLRRCLEEGGQVPKDFFGPSVQAIDPHDVSLEIDSDSDSDVSRHKDTFIGLPKHSDSQLEAETSRLAQLKSELEASVASLETQEAALKEAIGKLEK